MVFLRTGIVIGIIFWEDWELESFFGNSENRNRDRNRFLETWESESDFFFSFFLTIPSPDLNQFFCRKHNMLHEPWFFQSVYLLTVTVRVIRQLWICFVRTKSSVYFSAIINYYSKLLFTSHDSISSIQISQLCLQVNFPDWELFLFKNFRYGITIRSVGQKDRHFEKIIAHISWR